jgi:hypothetical protein
MKHGVVETPHFRPLQGWYIVPFRIEWPFAPKPMAVIFKVDLHEMHSLRRLRQSLPDGQHRHD